MAITKSLHLPGHSSLILELRRDRELAEAVNININGNQTSTTLSNSVPFMPNTFETRQLCTADNNYDAIAITETWLNSEKDVTIIKDASPVGCEFIHVPRINK